MNWSTLPVSLSDETFFFYAFYIVIFIALIRVLRMIYVLTVNKYLSFRSTSFSKTEGTRKILIIGDSTAVGTGAEKAEDTIAGRLARDFPDTQIKNFGVDGSLITGLKKQIAKVERERFDMIIVSSGGNDIWSFSSIGLLKKSLLETLKQAHMMAEGHVVFLLYNSIDHAPIFSKTSILRVILRYRCQRVQNAIRDTARRAQVPVIELFTETEEFERNPFDKNPKELYARDGIHPSSKGYGVWYNRMWRIMAQHGYSFSGRTMY